MSNKRQHCDITTSAAPTQQSGHTKANNIADNYNNNNDYIQLQQQLLYKHSNNHVYDNITPIHSNKKCGPKPGELDRLRSHIDTLKLQLTQLRNNKSLHNSCINNNQQNNNNTNNTDVAAVSSTVVNSVESTPMASTNNLSPQLYSRQATELQQLIQLYLTTEYITNNIQYIQLYYQLSNPHAHLSQLNNINLCNELLNIQTNINTIDLTWLVHYLIIVALGSVHDDIDYSLQTARLVRTLIGSIDIINVNMIHGLLLLSLYCIGWNMITQSKIYLSMCNVMIKSNKSLYSKQKKIYKYILLQVNKIDSTSSTANIFKLFNITFMSFQPPQSIVTHVSPSNTINRKLMNPTPLTPISSTTQLNATRLISNNSASSTPVIQSSSIIKPSLLSLDAQPQYTPNLSNSHALPATVLAQSQPQPHNQLLPSPAQTMHIQPQPILNSTHTDILHTAMQQQYPQLQSIQSNTQHIYNNPYTNNIYSNLLPDLVNYTQYYTQPSTARDILSNKMSQLPSIELRKQSHPTTINTISNVHNAAGANIDNNSMPYQYPYYVYPTQQ